MGHPAGQHRSDDPINDFEGVRFEGGTVAEVISAQKMFNSNLLFNKDDRNVEGLTPSGLAIENRKQF